MKQLSRVVWSEGMYLGPHHFQLQNRFFEDSVRFAVSSLWFEAWGLIGYELDAEALRNGTVSLSHCRGVFPDGLLFNMPDSDALPAPRNIADLFPPVRDSLLLMLAVPARKPDGLNCVDADAPASASVRYLAQPKTLHDETTGRDEKPVRLATKNIRFVLDIEPVGDMQTIAIARIKRDGAGRFIYDPEFIPPAMKISASERIMMILRRLIEILEDKSETLARGKAAGSKSWAEFSTRDIASFWMLHAVNAALAPLRHLFLSKRGHPEELYFELARLAGALCTFAMDSHPRSVPLYDHRKLEETFNNIDHHIRAHLETIVPTNCITIPLVKTADYFYEGEVTDQRCLGASRWVLAVRSPIGEADLIAKTPHIIKVCSKLFVPELVRRALPGLPLTHLPVPPSAISSRVDAQYFSISKSGPCWDHLVKTKQAGVYVPGELPEPDVELLVVLES
jgi:type VI secretion system protein ImpJ